MESAPVNPEFVPINPPGEEQPQLTPGQVEPETAQPVPLTQGGRRSRRRRSSRSRRQSRKSRRTRRSRRR